MLRVCNQSILGGTPHQHHTFLINTDHRGCQQFPQGIGDNDAFIVLPDADQAVSGAQIYPYDRHAQLPLLALLCDQVYTEQRRQK